MVIELMCCVIMFFFFFKQKTAYEMRISDWSSDVCSSDLVAQACHSASKVRMRRGAGRTGEECAARNRARGDASLRTRCRKRRLHRRAARSDRRCCHGRGAHRAHGWLLLPCRRSPSGAAARRSEEHPSELQSLMRISYAVFCLKKKTQDY